MKTQTAPGARSLTRMAEKPTGIPAAMDIMVLNAVLWFVFSAVTALGFHPALPDVPLLKAGMSIVSAAAGIVLVLLAHFLGRQYRLAFYASEGFLLLLAVSFVFDDIGWIDLALIVFTIIPAVLLFFERARFIGPKP